MNIKKKNLVLIIIATFVFTALLSCGVFALVAKSVSFNMVMHLNPTVYFGLELQVDSNGDGDFSDSFTSNNVAFNESTVYTIFDNRITNFVDHEPWAIVNLNKIVLQNTDAINNPFGDLGVNACFKIKVLNYTSPEMLEVDENSAEMQALWLTLVPEDMPSMYAVPEYGVQNVAYGSYKEFMIYPQSITTDYFEIPFTVELKNKTVDHAITINAPNGINGRLNAQGVANDVVSVTLGTVQTAVTNGHDFKTTLVSDYDVITIGSVQINSKDVAYTFDNQTKTLTIAGGNLTDTTSNNLVITIKKVGYMVLAGQGISTIINGGTAPTYTAPNNTIQTLEFGNSTSTTYSLAGYTATNVGLGENAYKIKVYVGASAAYILSDYNIYGNYSCISTCSCFAAATTMTFNNFDTSEVINFASFFYWSLALTTINGLTSFNTGKASSFHCMFQYCTAIESLDVSNFDTSNVTNFHAMFASNSKLNIIGLENFDTSNATNMNYMFWYYHGTNLNLTNFNTSKVTSMAHMFKECPNLITINISSFRTSNTTNMQYMFKGCTNLASLDLSCFKTTNLTDAQGMFRGCSALETIYVSDYWTMDKVTESSSMFLDCSTKLVGGNGTTWASTNLHDKTYAVYDGQEGKPGYFTYKKVTVAL